MTARSQTSMIVRSGGIVNKGANMYMLREVYQAQRGKVPEVIASLKVFDELYEQEGFTNRRIFVDYSGPMDTVVYECELESLGDSYRMERSGCVDPDAETTAVIEAFNACTMSGHRELYKVIQ